MALSEDQFKWLRDSHEELRKIVTQVRIDVAALKIKAGIWGLLGGMVPVAVIIILWLFKGDR